MVSALDNPVSLGSVAEIRCETRSWRRSPIGDASDSGCISVRDELLFNKPTV